ncbi:auxin-responsive family protein [Striga asiatica]|uniref:Cytochrome b561 and DOMON domain-containing protein n=1 Tax=Striga asiatica TaxID=4170 RepID=A0A5A7R6G4_STRAF|nr:auxin-responsive family protein [Striga asiatica]
MAGSPLPIIAALLFATAFSRISSQPANCPSQTFANGQAYSFCLGLSTLQSYLYWTFDRPTSTLSIAFICPAAEGRWISWAVNPTGTGMFGSQALVAFRESSGRMAVNTYNITGYALPPESAVWFRVVNSSADFSGQYMRLFATVVLPAAAPTTLNHIWQTGPFRGGAPAAHEFQPANLNARGSLDLLRGVSTGSTGGGSRTRKRNIHGVLNAVSWGIMFPIGIIIARYLRVFPSADPAWFYLHISCQISAYAIGVAGWGTGLKLGSESNGVTYSTHRNIGITLFTLATVQIFALLLRPNKDHKIRIYWNIYHHGIGYAILILGIINVFKGLDILQPENKWKTAFIVVISVLGGIAVLLEAITWGVVLRRKKSELNKPYDGSNNGRL